MPRVDIVRSVDITRTPRVAQVEGMFDMSADERSVVEWHVDFELPSKWNVGVIVGPSGAGKSTVAREVFGDAVIERMDWPHDRAIVDAFPEGMSIKDVTQILSSVGLASPPTWLRPYHVLSTGEKFRADVARAIASVDDLLVIDEFTSVVDRTVAKIGSAAVAKTVRRRGIRFVAVTCHYDVIDWLDPDWIYEPASNTMTRRCLQGRPQIHVEIRRVGHEMWELFRRHHYLDHAINKAAKCFCGFVDGSPAVFVAVLHHPHATDRGNSKRFHRIVCLPDFQGVGLGRAVTDHIAAAGRALGNRMRLITSHPQLIHAYARSSAWRMITAPTMRGAPFPRGGIARRGSARFARRLRAVFEYVGKEMKYDDAHALWHDKPLMHAA